MIDIDAVGAIAVLLENLSFIPYSAASGFRSDTNEANQLSKFCRKFSVPLRQALRKEELLSNKPLAKRPLLHVLFVNSAHALTGYSYSYNQTPYDGGILRLRMPLTSQVH